MSLRNPPLALVSWMLVSMVGVGGGVALGWSFWLIGIFGMGLLSLAYLRNCTAWNQEKRANKKIFSGVQQLQQLCGNKDVRTPLLPNVLSLEKIVSPTVAAVQEQMTSLEEERKKIVAIMENLVEGVLAFDPNGQVLYANASAHSILGLDKGEIQGHSFWEIVRNQELAELIEECQHLKLHESRRVEIVLHTSEFMVLEVYALAIPFSDQKKGSVLVLHDVTKLRRLEQVRAEFIDNVSHELRTPLAAIVGYLETLMDEPSLDTPSNRKFVNIAYRHAERLNRLVNDLRSLSEIESRKVILHCESVEALEVVQEVCEMLQSQILKKGVQISNQVDKHIRVWVDRDRLVQILVNLVDNAIKYSPLGCHITFQAFAAGDRFVSLHVKDTGQGIPSIDLPRITERFYRVDRARSREEGGTGLGLSIVKHLLQLLRGELRIHSELGKGTTVEVVLPVSSAPVTSSS